MCLFRFNGPTSNTLLEVASPKTKKILPGPTVEVKTELFYQGLVTVISEEECKSKLARFRNSKFSIFSDKLVSSENV